MKKADKIFCNGTILTMDDNKPRAEALAVKDGKIICVGSDKEVEKYEGNSTEVVNLKAKTMVPGFIDSHTHAPGKGYIKLFRMDLQGAKTEEELLQRIRDYIKQNPSKEIYYGSGFNAGLFKGIESKKGPKKEKLDGICSDKPVMLTDESCHTLWLNSSALKKYNINKNTYTTRWR
jgi:predicted amidohydrolase YtcJ